jgi:hypothetical protein
MKDIYSCWTYIWKAFLGITLFVLVSDYANGQCTHTVRLTDTYGDGWNGGTVSVSVNGTVVQNNITFSSGSGPVDFAFSASTSQTIRVYLTASGSWPSEMRVQILNSVGTSLLGPLLPVSGTATSGGSTVAGSCPVSLTGDNCSNAQNLASLTSPYSATTVGYLNDISVCRTGFPDRVFYLDVPNGYTVNIWQSVNSYDSYHYMGYGSSCPGATTIYCIDDSDTQNNVWTNSTGATQIVWFVVDGFSGSGTFTLNWTLTAPVYDPCSSIPNISGCGVSTTSSHSGGGAGWSITSCGFSTPGQEKIYQFTAPSTGTYQLSVTSATGGFVDYFWKAASGGCNNSGWNCIEDIISAATYNAVTPMNFTAGTTYYILLDPEGTGSYSHTFSLVCPIYDPCASIPNISGCGVSVSGSNSSAAGVWNTYGGPFGVPGQEKLWTFTPPTTGLHTINVTAISGGSYVDFFYKAASIGCNTTSWTYIDDFFGTGASVSFNMTAGVQYYIMFDDEDQIASSVTFNLSCPAACTAPTLNSISVNSNCWITDDRHTYTITASASSSSGIGGSTYGILALVNFEGANAGNYGGYFGWNTSLALLNAAGYTLDQCEAAGGGFVGKTNGDYGSPNITLVSGSTSVSGSQRTVNFVVRPNGSFPILTANDISLYAQSTCGVAAGWLNFDLNFSSQSSQAISCPSNITVCGSQVVNYSTPTATCNTTVVRNAGLASGSTFPLGTNTVSYNTYYPNGAGGYFNYAPGASNQQIALAACESVYGVGNCSIGSCGLFTYYYQAGALHCDCSKPVGAYEFIYSNSGYTYVGDDYGGTRLDVVSGNQLFTRVKTFNTCSTGPSWTLAEPALGQGGASCSFTVSVTPSATLGSVSNAGPINFCDAGGNFSTPVTVSGQTGTVEWYWGSNNGAWNYWLASNSSGVCCFPKKTSNSDGNPDRIRYVVTNGSCGSVTSSTILIVNRYNEPPNSLSLSSSSYACNSAPGTITLTANFPAAINKNGTVVFYSGSCGGTLVGSVTAGDNTTAAAVTITAPSTTTTYFVRYEPGSGTSCSNTACVSKYCYGVTTTGRQCRPGCYYL